MTLALLSAARVRRNVPTVSHDARVCILGHQGGTVVNVQLDRLRRHLRWMRVAAYSLSHMEKKTGKRGILEYFLKNMGRIISFKELQQASGGQAEFARRIRELRSVEGYLILTHKDRADLKPGEYLLESSKRRPLLPRNISRETRAFVLERNGYTCQMCGCAAGDPDEFEPGRTIRLVMGHIIDKDKGGPDVPGNLRAVCTNCNQGLQNNAPPKPKRIELLKQVRRATVDDQLHLLQWLNQKFAKLPKT